MDYDKTLRELEGKLERYPRSLTFARLADAYLEAGEVDRALEICSRGLEEHPHYVGGLVVMGKCYFQRGDLERARKVFERALHFDRDNLVALKSLGDIYQVQGRSDLALAAYRRVLELDPLNEEIRKTISILEGESQPLEELGLTLEQAKGTAVDKGLPGFSVVKEEEEEETLGEPDVQFDTITLAEVYASQGLTERAVGVLRRILQRQPDREDVKVRLGELEERLRQEGGE